MADEIAPGMTPAERARASVLMIEPDAMSRSSMRTCLKSLGYGGMSDVPNHAQAIEKLAERKFTHIFFDARKTNMPPKEFLAKVLELDPMCICIPASFEPNVDDVFDLLISGARGYLVKPFTIESVEQSIVTATKGEQLPDMVRNAKDRNEALVAILMSSLDKAATIMRQSLQFETAKREIPRAMMSLKRAADLAKMFSRGGEEGMIEAIEKFCIDRSKGPATRLGRLRKRLQTNRGDEQPDA